MMDELVSKLHQLGNPLIHQNEVTFVWRGAQAPNLFADFQNHASLPLMLEKFGQDIWVYTATLRSDAYIEYAFLDPKTGERIPDPFNPQTTPNGFGEINHYFYMPEGSPTPLIQEQRGIPRGEITRYRVPTGGLAVGSHRTLNLYQPPTTEPSPLLLVFDGLEYLQRARLPQMVDNLISQGRIKPVAMALLENHPQVRMVEYMCNEATVGWIQKFVLPFCHKHLNLTSSSKDDRGRYAVLGSSMGGLMALYTALRVPHIFHKVLAQSGAYSMDGQDMVVYELIQSELPKPIQIWMDVGRYDFLLQTNQRMQSVLRQKGYLVDYREYPGGHNYPSWRDDLEHGLVALFGDREV